VQQRGEANSVVWAEVMASSPIPKDVPDTKKEEGSSACSLPKACSVHVQVAISICPEKKRKK